MAVLIDGKQVASELRARVRDAARRFESALGRTPRLAVLLVGDDPASASYVRLKARACEAEGLRADVVRLPRETMQSELLARLESIQSDDTVDGVLVQLPLPAQIEPAAILRALDPARDVDGLHPLNAGALFEGRPRLIPCTPLGCVRLLEHAGVPLDGREALVIGRSNLVGRPTAMLLLARNATVTMAHARTHDLASVCRRADVVVAAAGRAELVRGPWIKPGAAVLDVGMNHRDDGTLVGDVAFAEAEPVAGWITRVPGGVGPMTVACLLENVVRAAWTRARLPADGLGL